MRSLALLRPLLRARNLLVVSLVAALAVGLGISAMASGDVGPDAADLRQARLGGAPAGDEVVGLRTEFSRSFRQPDGGLQTRVSLAPTNYRGADGAWKVIDPTLRRTTSGLENTAGAVKIELPNRANSGDVRLAYGNLWVAFGMRGASDALPDVKGNRARFAEALSDVDVDYEVGAESVKESIVLASPEASSSYEFAVSASGGLTPELDENGEVVFRSASGSRKFTMVAPWMRDAAGETSYDVHYTLDPRQGGGWTVRVKADEAWLRAPDRQFPVVIDPTTYYGISKMCEIASGSLGFHSDCTSSEMPIDVGRENGRVHRALIQFDTAELRSTLGDQLVTNADLFFYWTTNVPGDVTLDLHPVSRNWSVATWYKYTSVSYWSQAGGDFSTTYDTRRTLQSGWENGWTGLGVGRLVQGWLDGSIVNYGVVIKPQNEGLVRLDTLDGVGLVIDSRPRRGIEPQASFETVQPTGSSKVQVNVANGNLVYRDEDARLPAGSDALTLARTFNSLGDLATGTFGSGWSTNHGTETTLWQHWVDGSYILEGPDGLAGRFHRNPDGTYTAPPGWNASLVENGDGTVSVTFTATGERWDFDTSDPRKLTRIVKGGYEQTLTYDGAGKLTQVSDNQGNQLDYGYDGQTDRISTLTNGTSQRGYVLNGSDQLTQFTAPNGDGQSYTYDTNGRLEQITYPGGTRIALAYDATGRVTSITTKPDDNAANNRTTSFAYSSPTSPCNSGDYGKTTVTYPNSQTRTYCYSRTNAVRIASPITSSDITDPVLTLSDEAWEDRDDWHNAGTLPLHVFASDAHSGIKTIETKIDSTVVDTNTQTCAAGSCTMERSPSIDTSGLSAGSHAVQVVATDQANRTTTRSWTIKVDPADPSLAVSGTLWTERDEWLDDEVLTLTAQGADTGAGVASVTVLVDDQQEAQETQTCPVGGCDLTATAMVDAAALSNGTHTVKVVVADLAGNTHEQTWDLRIDHADPGLTLDGDLAAADGGTLELGDHTLEIAATDPGGSGVRSVEVKIDGTQFALLEQPCAQGGCSLNHTASVTAIALPAGQHTVTVIATDGVGRTTQQQSSFEVTDPGGTPIQAPAIDPTKPTTVGNSTEFIYSGSDPVQTGMTPGVLEQKRIAVVRGVVRDRLGDPQGGVTVTVLDHPEYGETVTRSDGQVYLALNGGQTYTLNYAKDGFLPVQRQVTAPWQQWEIADDVVLVHADDQSTQVDFSQALSADVVHQADPVTDSDGTRQATVVLPEGTEATMNMPDGSTQPLGQATIRATEFTVGQTGTDAMPATLPTTSAYTYAAEYSIDEAMAAGAESVEFSQPVLAYERNFLDFPVGVSVPVGYYNRSTGVWEPSPDGRVVKILSTSGGTAQIDVMGDGTAATATQLDGLKITQDELAQLATLYDAGDEIWRVQLRHFSPFDFNWSVRLPSDADGPTLNDLSGPTDDGCSASGSVIGCEDQTLGESIPIEGTGLRLHYQSNRMPGYRAGRILRFKIAGNSAPHPDLQSISVRAEIAGRTFEEKFQPPQSGQEYRLSWDGKDEFGRTVHGTQDVRVQVSYTFNSYYSTGVPYPFSDDEFIGGFYSFAAQPAPDDRINDPAGYGIEASPADPGSSTGCQYYVDPQTGACIPLWGGVGGMPETRVEQSVTRVFKAKVGGTQVAPEDLGGWTLSDHHSYDAVGQRVEHGDGSSRSASAMSSVVRRVMSESQASGMGATNVSGLAVASDGTIYISQCNLNRVLRRTPAGQVSTYAGNGTGGFSGDGGPATQAQLLCPAGLDLQADGSLLIADVYTNRVRRVAPNGTITTFAGNGLAKYGGDGGQAANASLWRPRDVAVGPDGSVFIADQDNGRVRQVTTTGTIRTYLQVDLSFCPDGGATCSERPWAVAIAPDGTLYTSTYDRDYVYNKRVLRLEPGQSVPTTTAQTGPVQTRPDVDGVPVATANVQATDLDVAPNGDLYLMEVAPGAQGRVRKVGADGIIRRVAGNPACPAAAGGSLPAFPEVEDANVACLNGAENTIDFGPDGDPYITESTRPGVRAIGKPVPGVATGGGLIASEDGSEVYEFDGDGKHLTTRDADTGATTATFSYNTDGHLTSQQDADGNTVTVQRSSSGQPEAIIGPFGAQTDLTLNTEGLLDTVTDPAGQPSSFDYDTDGLLTGYTEPGDKQHTYTYDTDGYLIADENPDGETTTLSRSEQSDGHTVALTSNLGRSREHVVERLDGDIEHREVTDPADNTSQWDRTLAGERTLTQPDGTTVKAVQGGDPRFGTQSPFALNSTLTLPSNRTVSQTTSRSAQTSTPGNPFTLTGKTETSTVNGKTATGSYAAATKRYTTTSPTGRQWKVDVDTKGRITHSEVAGSDPVDFAYDTRGRISTVTTGTRTWTYSYASTGYLQTVQGPENTSASYVTDPNGRVTTATLPGNREIAFTYDPRGNLTSLTPPGQSAHTFEYTDGGKVSRIVPPAISGVDADTQFAYDSDGALASLTRPGGEIVDFDYDTAGRPSTISSTDGDIDFTYHTSGAGKGKLNSVTAPGGQSLAYSYDGPLVTSLTASGGTNGTITYDYDTDLRPASVALAGTPTVGYSYDNDGLLTSAGPLSITRDAATGRATSVQLGDVVTSRAFDTPGRLASLTNTVGGSSLLGATYTYDDLDRIATKTETTPAGSTTYGYEYDAAGRLQRVTKDGQTWRQYAYDANGNRTSDQQAGQLAVTSTYDAQDRLTQRGSEQFTYTDAGELATRTDTSTSETTTYHHTARGLTGVVLPDGTEITYTLDGMGRRVAVKHDGTVVARYLYGLEAIGPVAELNADNTVRSRFVYASRAYVPDYMVRDGVTYRLVTDELGSVRRVINIATGVTEQTLDYDPYGVVTTNSQPGFQPFGFTGGLTDQDTGLVRLGYRDYDPALGRWTSKDPIGHNGGDTNLYAYVAGDPVNAIDPSGLILDTLLDIAFITYDAATIAGKWAGGCAPSSTDFAALGADIGAAFVPFGTGFGAGVRGAAAAKGAAKGVETERIGQSVKASEATSAWDEFLGAGEHTNIHPRLGTPDPNRIVSEDGTRSIRLGPHEMNSSPNKFHYHEETWTHDPVTNTMNVDNVLRRVRP